MNVSYLWGAACMWDISDMSFSPLCCPAVRFTDEETEARGPGVREGGVWAGSCPEEFQSHPSCPAV